MEFIVFFLLKKLADMIQCLTEQLYHICLTIACEKGCSHISYLLDGNQNNKSCPEGQNAINDTGLFDMYPQSSHYFPLAGLLIKSCPFHRIYTTPPSPPSPLPTANTITPFLPGTASRTHRVTMLLPLC